MARKKERTPFDKILTARSKLNLYVEYGSGALRDQPLPEFLAEVNEAFEYLMAFRNMVNGMASMQERPEISALSYISPTDIEEVSV